MAGSSNAIFSLIPYNGNLIAAGSFSSAGGGSAFNIAQWNGSAWSALAGGLNNNVNAVAVYNDKLIATGIFTASGGTGMVRMAQWNGTTWSAMGSGLGGTGATLNGFALAVHGGELVVSGTFTTAGGQVSTHLARWGGTGTTVAADFDFDCDVDTQDFNIFKACATRSTVSYVGNLPAGCTLVPNGSGNIAADFDQDDDVDQTDFGSYQRCFGGTGQPVPASCGI